MEGVQEINSKRLLMLSKLGLQDAGLIPVQMYHQGQRFHGRTLATVDPMVTSVLGSVLTAMKQLQHCQRPHAGMGLGVLPVGAAQQNVSRM